MAHCLTALAVFTVYVTNTVSEAEEFRAEELPINATAQWCFTCLFDWTVGQQLYPVGTNYACNCVERPINDTKCTLNNSDVFFSEDVAPENFVDEIKKSVDEETQRKSGNELASDSPNPQTSDPGQSASSGDPPGRRKRRQEARRFVSMNNLCLSAVKIDVRDQHIKVIRIGVGSSSLEIYGNSCKYKKKIYDGSFLLLYCFCNTPFCNDKVDFTEYIVAYVNGQAKTHPSTGLALILNLFLLFRCVDYFI